MGVEDLTTSVAKAIAEQGLLFAALVAFIAALKARWLLWGYQGEEKDQRIAELKDDLAKRDGKIEALDAHNRELTDIVKSNTATTSSAVEGFKRALDELERRSTWSGEERRARK